MEIISAFGILSFNQYIVYRNYIYFSTTGEKATSRTNGITNDNKEIKKRFKTKQTRIIQLR